MKSVLVVYHLAAVVLAAGCLWWMRHEYTQKAATRFEWAIAPVLALIVAVVLLIASPGKRFELWAAAIFAGLALGAFMGTLLKVNQDVGLRLIRVPRSWDGLAAASLLFLLALVRFVTSDLIVRPSGKFGVLGALAAFLAAYIGSRFLVVLFYKTPRAIHLDMIHGKDPNRTLIH